MSKASLRFEHVRRSTKVARLLAVVGVGILIVVGCYHFSRDLDPWPWFGTNLLAFAVLGCACVLCALFVFLWNLVNLLLKIEGNSFRSYGVLRDLLSALNDQQPDIKAISENAQLSDVVRSVRHRDKERNALRLAINEEVIRGDWEAAYALVALLKARHGYDNEAARLREEVDQSRRSETQNKLHEAVEQFSSFIQTRDWNRARREMDRLMAEHPDNAEVRTLPAAFAKARADHKRRLLKDWDELVQRNEVDRGISILRELDQFISPNEAEALQESARDVFRKKLHNLGVQFSLAVTEKAWREAYEVGKQIREEFPNSRMAQEVRERIHVLAKRASETPESAPAQE